MPVTKRQLAASVLSATHIVERDVIAAFILDEATEFSTNPFGRTSAATVRHVWGAQAFEFRVMDVHAVGLPSLLAGVSTLSKDTPLVQEILRSGPHTLNAFHHGDGCRIVGAVLYGRPRVQLPALQTSRASPSMRRRAVSTQLDLFACSGD